MADRQAEGRHLGELTLDPAKAAPVCLSGDLWIDSQGNQVTPNEIAERARLCLGSRWEGGHS